MQESAKGSEGAKYFWDRVSIQFALEHNPAKVVHVFKPVRLIKLTMVPWYMRTPHPTAVYVSRFLLPFTYQLVTVNTRTSPPLLPTRCYSCMSHSHPLTPDVLGPLRVRSPSPLVHPATPSSLAPLAGIFDD